MASDCTQLNASLTTASNDQTSLLPSTSVDFSPDLNTNLNQTQSLQTTSPTTLDEKRSLEENERGHKTNIYKGAYHPAASPYSSNTRLLNDAKLIADRRINCNQKARKCFELMCEDKVSRYKLEEVHCSLPSSVKSTFIMTFSPDGQRVASTHNDHRIYICDLNTGKLLDTLEGHPKTPWCLAWHSTNREILASGCLAGEVRVWDLKSKACETWTSENNTIITSLDFHPKERVLVIATANDIHFWDWSEAEPFAKTTTTHDKEKVKFVEFDSSGTKLITGISNSPKFAGYSSDSLQNRIIDSYLTQGTIDQSPTENMTQNSEITDPLNTGLNAASNATENFNERNTTLQAPILNRPLVPGVNSNNDQDISYRSTLTLSRVAFLYRQLESLEDSMRHTSFSPYFNPRSIGSSSEQIERSLPLINQERSQLSPATHTDHLSVIEENNNHHRNVPTTQEPSQGREEQIPNNPLPPGTSDSQSGSSLRTTNTFEPSIVSFDESLEHLQLSPLIIDGQTINLATVIEQYPIDFPWQLHYMLQFESINQVNQNFIRISKLMSSARLYRQVVQQILSSENGRGHFQPNQILTAQSTSLRSPRHAANLPVVFRNFPIGSIDSNNRMARSTDPILAIQFRNSARNVPLVTMCKMDLLSARSVCIMRSQQLIEQAFAGLRNHTNQNLMQDSTSLNTNSLETNQTNQQQQSASSNQEFNGANTFFHALLFQLYESLSVINHAPLTTSNVHTYIPSLRSLVNKILVVLSTMFQTREEGQRLIGLIHNIAHSLTGRSWDIPLGATLDDIRLDVIHTLCIVDSTLHLIRQVQLLQMQRLSAIVRVEESRRMTNSDRNSNRLNSNIGVTTATTTTTTTTASGSQNASMTNKTSEKFYGPSTSREVQTNKRKEEAESGNSENIKKIKINSESTSDLKTKSSTEMIENSINNPSVETIAPNQVDDNGQPVNYQNAPLDQYQTDRLVVWNSPANQAAAEQSLQRFLVATASNMSNSHILVRIYSRLNGSPTLPPNNIIDQPIERSNQPPLESRRRALSQDNSTATNLMPQDSASSTINDHSRMRQVHVYPAPVMHNPLGFASPYERQPHLHVYQTRGSGQHLWFNQWTIPLPISNSNYRLQCWNFSMTAIPNIKDSQANLVTQKCRIHNDSSIDISSDGSLIACLVPRDDGACVPNFDMKIFSLRMIDFASCYYQLSHGPNAISVSLSPSASYAVVGLASHKVILNDSNDDDLVIAKIFKLDGKNPSGCVRDIKIKRDDSSLSLNAIRWMSRGIVYNVGPQHHQRYQAGRMRNRNPY